MSFTTALTIGAALLGCWLDVRFEGKRPASIVRRMVHLAVAYVLLQAGVFAAAHIAGRDAGDAQRLTAVFVLLLPSFVYAFLTCFWLVRTLVDVTGVARR